MKLGIIGTGRIASRFVKTASEDVNIESICVYNPHKESLVKFVKDNGISEFTTDFNEFAAVVDAVYIASPHQTHYEYAKAMLTAGKHVLCEKPMVFEKRQAEELFKLAAMRGCVLMEALKTAYCPGFSGILEAAASGKIGKITDVESCFTRLTPSNLREMTDSACGGCFTELGTYTLLPIIKLLGCDYKSINFKSITAPNGVDVYTKAYIDYDNAFATAKNGFRVKSEGQLLISGTKGYIIVPSPWWLTKNFMIRYEDPSKIENYYFEFDGSGLQYELQVFEDRIKGIDVAGIGLTDDESIAMAGIMQQFLEKRAAARGSLQRHANNTVKDVKIWAHRGCSMKYPENTLMAFEAAAKLDGITGIELDVQLTKDGKLVVFHDENVSRVTDGKLGVRDYTYEEIRKLRVAYADELSSQIPSLDEVLALLKPYCFNKGLLINIELKTSKVRYEGIEEKTLECVKSHGLEKYIVYSSFLPESVKHMKELDADVKTGILASSLSDCIELAVKTGADALHPWIGGFDCDIPESMKDMPVRAWNGEEPFFKDGRVLREKNLTKYSAFGATEVFTNVPEIYLK